MCEFVIIICSCLSISRELSGLSSYLEKLAEEQTTAKQQLDDYIKDILQSKHTAEKQLLDMKRTMIENAGAGVSVHVCNMS